MADEVKTENTRLIIQGRRRITIKLGEGVKGRFTLDMNACGAGVEYVWERDRDRLTIWRDELVLLQSLPCDARALVAASIADLEDASVLTNAAAMKTTIELGGLAHMAGATVRWIMAP